MRGTVIIVLLYFLSAVVEVCSQTVPYISFMGTNLPNHSYIDLTPVGDDLDGSSSVQCHTDLTTCCSPDQGPDRGDWYFPGGNRLPFSRGIANGVFEARQAQRVDLRVRGSPTLPDGIYRCDIETNTTGYDTRKPIYVGLYQISNTGQYMIIYMYRECVARGQCRVSMTFFVFSWSHRIGSIDYKEPLHINYRVAQTTEWLPAILDYTKNVKWSIMCLA